MYGVSPLLSIGGLFRERIALERNKKGIECFFQGIRRTKRILDRSIVDCSITEYFVNREINVSEIITIGIERKILQSFARKISNTCAFRNLSRILNMDYTMVTPRDE